MEQNNVLPQDVNDQYTVQQDYGFGNKVDIDQHGNPIQPQQQVQQTPEQDTADALYEKMSKYDFQEAWTKYKVFKGTLLKGVSEELQPFVAANLNSIEQHLRNKYRARLRAELKKIPYDSSDRAEAEQLYRDALHRMAGIMPASKVDDYVIDAIGGGTIAAPLRAGRILFNRLTGDTKEANELQVEAKEISDAQKQFGTVSQVGPLEIPLDGNIPAMFIPFNSTVRGWTMLAEAIQADKTVKALGKAQPVLDKLWTAGNLSKVGLARNTAFGAMFAYGYGADWKGAVVGGVAGMVIPAGASAIGKTVSPVITHYLGTDLAKQELNLAKLEKSAGVTKDELTTIYKQYAEDANIDMSELTPADKATALRAKYDNIDRILAAASEYSPQAQRITEQKSKEAVVKVMSKLFDIKHIDDPSPAGLKKAAKEQVEELIADMRTAINQITDDISTYIADFAATSKKVKLDTPVFSDEITGSLRRAIDDMDPKERRVLRSVEKFLDDKPSIDNLADITKLERLIPDNLKARAETTSGMPLESMFNDIAFTHLDEFAYSKYSTMKDAVKLKDWMQSATGLRTIFNSNAPTETKATALRKFMSSDSYAPLTKLLSGKQLEQLEDTAFASLFTKDGILTETGRANFWALYRDARQMHTVTERAAQMKELMAMNAKYIGSSKIRPGTRTEYETGSKGRSSIQEEMQSRAIGHIIASVIQHFPFDYARQTYNIRNGINLLKGERVFDVRSIDDARVLSIMDKALTQQARGLQALNISSDLTYEQLLSKLDSAYFDARSTKTTRAAAEPTFMAKEGNTDIYVPHGAQNEVFNILKTDMKFNIKKPGEYPLKEVVHSKALSESKVWSDLRDYKVVVTPDSPTRVDVHDKKIYYNTSDDNGKLVQEIAHAIDYSDGRRIVGSSVGIEWKNLQKQYPQFADISPEFMANAKWSHQYAVLMQKLGVTSKDQLTPELRKQLKELSPMYKYFTNEGEIRTLVAEKGNVKNKDEVLETIRGLMQRAEEWSDKAIDEAFNYLDRQFDVSAKGNKVDDTYHAVQTRNSNPANFTQYDNILADLDMLVLNGTRKMDPVALLAWLNKQGYSDNYLKDIGFDDLVLMEGTKVSVPAIITRLEDKMYSGNMTRTYYGTETRFSTTMDKSQPSNIELLPALENHYERVFTTDTYDLPESITEPMETHFGYSDYKSHAIYRNVKYNNEKAVYVQELQNDLLSAGMFPDTVDKAKAKLDKAIATGDEQLIKKAKQDYDFAVENEQFKQNQFEREDLENELDRLNSAMPNEDSIAYSEWEDEYINVERQLAELSNEKPYATKDEVRKYVVDKTAYIRDAINAAISDAMSTDARYVVLPTSDVMIRRYNDEPGNASMYKRLYDKDIPKVLRKYAKAHNLKPPYKDGEVWVLDIKSVANQKLENKRTQANEWWFKM